MRTKTAYRCTECGAEFSKWQGRCDTCGEWNTLVEEIVAPKVGASGGAARRIGGTRSLAEGGNIDSVLAMIGKHMGTGALLCSHGDIIPAVLESLAAGGIDLGPEPRCPKGCTWVLESEHGGDITRVSYLPPPLEPGE